MNRFSMTIGSLNVQLTYKQEMLDHAIKKKQDAEADIEIAKERIREHTEDITEIQKAIAGLGAIGIRYSPKSGYDFKADTPPALVPCENCGTPRNEHTEDKATGLPVLCPPKLED